MYIPNSLSIYTYAHLHIIVHLHKGICLSIWHIYICIYSVSLEECHYLIFIKHPHAPSICIWPWLRIWFFLSLQVHEDSLEKFLSGLSINKGWSSLEQFSFFLFFVFCLACDRNWIWDKASFWTWLLEIQETSFCPTCSKCIGLYGVHFYGKKRKPPFISGSILCTLFFTFHFAHFFCGLRTSVSYLECVFLGQDGI